MRFIGKYDRFCIDFLGVQKGIVPFNLSAMNAFDWMEWNTRGFVTSGKFSNLCDDWPYKIPKLNIYAGQTGQLKMFTKSSKIHRRLLFHRNKDSWWGHHSEFGEKLWHQKFLSKPLNLYRTIHSDKKPSQLSIWSCLKNGIWTKSS